MLLEEDPPSLQLKAKLPVANVPAIVRFTLRRKHAGVPVDQQFINRHVKCPPEPLALNRTNPVLSNRREGEDRDINS